MERPPKKKKTNEELIISSVIVFPVGTPVSYNLCANKMIYFPSTLNEIILHHKSYMKGFFFILLHTFALKNPCRQLNEMSISISMSSHCEIVKTG